MHLKCRHSLFVCFNHILAAEEQTNKLEKHVFHFVSIFLVEFNFMKSLDFANPDPIRFLLVCLRARQKQLTKLHLNYKFLHFTKSERIVPFAKNIK